MPFHYSYGQWLPCRRLNQSPDGQSLLAIVVLNYRCYATGL